jgi:hypothetical protein
LSSRPALASLEQLQKLPWRGDRRAAAQRQQVLVARDELRTLAGREREEVVVPGILGSDRRCHGRIRNELRKLAHQEHEALGVGARDSVPHLRVRKRPLELGEQHLRDDQLEFAGEPQLDQARRSARSRKESRDQDVDVEDRAHALRAACLVLSLDAKPQPLVLVEVGRLPDALEKIEPEVAAQRLLDHLAVPAPGPCGLDPYGS